MNIMEANIVTKEIDISQFEVFELDGAIWWLEDKINHYLANGYRDVKGEIILIDNRWRVSVMSDTRQMGFYFEED